MKYAAQFIGIFIMGTFCFMVWTNDLAISALIGALIASVIVRIEADRDRNERKII